jgi:hypothetical protein
VRPTSGQTKLQAGRALEHELANLKKTAEPNSDQLTIEIGDWFKATASGRPAVLALIGAGVAVLATRMVLG